MSFWALWSVCLWSAYNVLTGTSWSANRVANRREVKVFATMIRWQFHACSHAQTLPTLLHEAPLLMFCVSSMMLYKYTPALISLYYSLDVVIGRNTCSVLVVKSDSKVIHCFIQNSYYFCPNPSPNLTPTLTLTFPKLSFGTIPSSNPRAESADESLDG